MAKVSPVISNDVAVVPFVSAIEIILPNFPNSSQPQQSSKKYLRISYPILSKAVMIHFYEDLINLI
ncbi:MAG: hypothetical protein EOO03_01525 [Chitinophagaceae bacterium]|nr:MAG: hypothetical protein EOO03_01525 [Chitinophagaceae bacterium]